MLIKPDGVQRRLIGEILSRIEGKGLTIAALELQQRRRRPVPASTTPNTTANRSSDSLLEFITSGPVVAAIVEGPRAVAAFRQIAGATDPVEKAAPGTIRGDLALITQDNLVHGSDLAGIGGPRNRALVSLADSSACPAWSARARADVGYWRSGRPACTRGPDARMKTSTSATIAHPRCGADRPAIIQTRHRDGSEQRTARGETITSPGGSSPGP